MRIAWFLIISDWAMKRRDHWNLGRKGLGAGGGAEKSRSEEACSTTTQPMSAQNCPERIRGYLWEWTFSGARAQIRRGVGLVLQGSAIKQVEGQRRALDYSLGVNTS